MTDYEKKNFEQDVKMYKEFSKELAKAIKNNDKENIEFCRDGAQMYADRLAQWNK